LGSEALGSGATAEGPDKQPISGISAVNNAAMVRVALASPQGLRSGPNERSTFEDPHGHS